jgi:hypothetical protein
VAQVYQLVDDNGVTRLFVEIVPDPAGTPFDGGTITTPLNIAPTAPSVPLGIQGASGFSGNMIDVVLGALSDWEASLSAADHGGNNVDIVWKMFANGTGTAALELEDDSGNGHFRFATDTGLDVSARTGTVGNMLAVGIGSTVLFAITSTGAVGFFGAAAAAQQTLHSATATPEQIALALEASTLMTGD